MSARANGANGADHLDSSNGSNGSNGNGALPPRGARLRPRSLNANGNGAHTSAGASSVVAGSTGTTNGHREDGAAAIAALPALAGTNGSGPPVATVVAAPASGAPVPGARKKASLQEVFASFALRDFRYLTLSTLAAGFAQWAQQLAIFALVYDMTGSSVQLGAVAAFRGGIGTLISPFGGYLADRYPRRSLILVSAFFGAALAAVLATLVVTDLVHVWHVYIIAFGGGLVQSINQPARQAFVYDVTTDETLPNAIAMNSMVQNVSRVLGPSGFGVMMAAWGVGSALIALVVLQITAMVVTMMISRRSRQVFLRGDASPLRLMGEGFKYSWEDKRILGLIVVSMIPSLLVYPYIPFLKVVSETVLDRGNAGFGMLSSMMGWGSLVGLFFLAYLGRASGRGRLMLGGFIVYSAMLVGFAASSNFYLSLGILATAGIFHSVAMALNQTLIQQATRNELRGRVMSVLQMSHGLQPLGSLPMGLLIASQGAQIGIGAFMATATVAFVLFALLWSSVRRMQ